MYLLDANVLIDAKNRYYAFDIAPGFWAWLDGVLVGGRACSIKAVYDELVLGNDELSKWARDHKSFFKPVDQHVVRYFQPLSAWAASQSFTQAALNAFAADAADYLLVAFGAAYQCTVVTNERPDPKSHKRVKIPDACNALEVAWDTPWNMLRATGAVLKV
ncbi:DUF4411 family protein [Actinomyces weissii]|uniref:DUF4411 family protein n=1 Tax=Actinomyces weissii TaxID=675090 RepID=A0A7T7S1X9_9ACTO|nr:DUF4411 family protein [Actinomyces weissii]QQM67411.1 DUF4411 family protein [Actinomyces weissii]